MHRTIFLTLAAALCAVTLARADVATLLPSADNSIFENNLNNSLGGGQVIFVGANAQSVTRRGLISFNIAASIPAGSTINSAQLTLYLNSVPAGSTASPTIRLFRVLADWGEGTAGNTTNGANGAGQGFAAGEGDATWLARHYSATTPTPWLTEGGDFSAIDSASRAIAGTILNTPYTWATTPTLVADVQTWLDTPAANFGWLLKSDSETTPSAVRGFWSRESARTGQGAFSPQLQITYTPIPEPVSATLIIASALLSRRQRP